MPTISDVAKRAGVSQVTVSRVINNAGNVKKETRIRVAQAIEELGYVPSGVAKSLRLKRTKTLALIVPDIQNAFWTTVARGVEDAAQSRGYSIFLCNTDENAGKQRHYLEVVVSQRVDGVIIAPCDNNPENLSLLRRRQVPTVVMDRYVNDWDVDTVMGDSISASRALVKHLISLGHERIAMISGPLTTSTSTDRILGYRLALAESGLPYDPELIRTGEYRSISGERLTHQLLASDKRPTAIFAANNVIALGVIDALEAHRIRVPEDMALVCFDDLPNTSRLFPFLTVAVQPAYDLGANAAQLMLSRLESEHPLPSRGVVLPSRLVIRHSCGSTLASPDLPTLSLPSRNSAYERIELVKPLTPDERDLLSSLPDNGNAIVFRNRISITDYEKPDAGRITAALQFEQVDRVPHAEFSLSDSFLTRQAAGFKSNGGNHNHMNHGVTPDESVGFARRVGLDAVICDFSHHGQPGASPDDVCQTAGRRITGWSDFDLLEKPVVVADQLNKLEHYLLAADGANVGVFVGFDSFFDCALRAVGDDHTRQLFSDRFFFERLLDIFLAHQERVMQAVCDRFADDISFVLVRDAIANDAGPLLPVEQLEKVYVRRMQRLIAPAKDHGLSVAISTPGAIVSLLPTLKQIGFDIIHPASVDGEDIRALADLWPEDMVFAGGMPADLLRDGSPEDVEQQVRDLYVHWVPRKGYIFGVSGVISDETPPENYLAMTQALHQYCRDGQPGIAAVSISAADSFQQTQQLAG